MIKLVPSEFVELAILCEMESAQENTEFILSSTLAAHQQLFIEPNVYYLNIQDGDEIVGFILLAAEPDKNSVEFRRIVVSKKGMGIGQKALQLMEAYVLVELKMVRIWLDVFAKNKRALHIYQKQGYSQFDSLQHNNKTLLLLEKDLVK